MAVPKLSVIKEVWQPELKLANCEYLLKHIQFTTYISLPKQALNYDLLILEEVHNVTPAHDHWLSQFRGKILGLTGTPPKDIESDKARLIAKYCPIVYTYFITQAVNDKILNNYRIIVHPVKLSTKRDIEVKYKDKKTGQEKTFLASEESTYKHLTRKLAREKSPEKKNMAKIYRMIEMKSFKSKEVYAKKLLSTITDKCIIFCNTKEQADRLCDYSYHSSNPESDYNLKLFNAGNIMQMSTILQLMEGINIKNLRQGVILTSYSGDSPKFLQRFGRLMRLKPDETATCHLLCFEDSIEEHWVASALEGLDKSKITYLSNKKKPDTGQGKLNLK